MFLNKAQGGIYCKYNLWDAVDHDKERKQEKLHQQFSVNFAHHLTICDLNIWPLSRRLFLFVEKKIENSYSFGQNIVASWKFCSMWRIDDLVDGAELGFWWESFKEESFDTSVGHQIVVFQSKSFGNRSHSLWYNLIPSPWPLLGGSSDDYFGIIFGWNQLLHSKEDWERKKGN